MKITVLDHGYVELIETWGVGKDGQRAVGPDGPDYHDPSKADYEVGIVEAARQSTQGSFRGWDERLCEDEGCPQRGTAHEHPGDAYLLRYLYNNDHATPFEFAGMVIEVQAPLMVFREWHRHRTQSYNEASARYAPLPDLYYVPERSTVLERGRASSSNKQAAGVTAFNEHYTDAFLANVDEIYKRAEHVYQMALANGIPKELARLVMPVGHYSKMRASANLRNWLWFMSLRCDEKAQWEIRQFANAVSQLVENRFPRVFALWQAKHAAPKL